MRFKIDLKESIVATNTINCTFFQSLSHLCGVVKISKQLTRKMCNSYLEKNSKIMGCRQRKQLPSVDL